MMCFPMILVSLSAPNPSRRWEKLARDFHGVCAKLPQALYLSVFAIGGLRSRAAGSGGPVFLITASTRIHRRRASSSPEGKILMFLNLNSQRHPGQSKKRLKAPSP